MLGSLDVSIAAITRWLLRYSFTPGRMHNPLRCILRTIQSVMPYIPGEFFRRELPCLLTVLAKVQAPLNCVLIDGYVWLSAERKPGLGAHLYEALGRKTSVIGVAKTYFRGAPAIEVQRGRALKPLYVSAAGIDTETAANYIQGMHGKYRIPTMLKWWMF